MKKRLYFLGAAVAAVVAIVTSYFYAESNRAWLLAVTGCAAMLLVVCVTALLLCMRGGSSKIYSKKKRYISEAEQAFLGVLRSAVDGRFEVCVQAPLVAVIDKAGSAFRNELFRVADYLIVDRASYEPLLLIELNDASHRRADRIERDRKVAAICAEANMPLLTFTTEQSHNAGEVKKTVLKALRR